MFTSAIEDWLVSRGGDGVGDGDLDNRSLDRDGSPPSTKQAMSRILELELGGLANWGSQ